MFPTSYNEILALVDEIDPVKYAYNRNYIDGNVTRLSPYISRGVISTIFVYERLQQRGFKLWQIEKFVQELAWRDYWQLIWCNEGNRIDKDLKAQQLNVRSKEMPEAMLRANTGISAIDEGIKTLMSTGYIHNHVRMYLAAVVCNVAQCNWERAAQWMYYHLLDADWASNALSWQWVAGTNSNKKYYANQENINKYCYTNDSNTFLDKSYEELMMLTVPEQLSKTAIPELITVLPPKQNVNIHPDKPLLIYNFYNLDPLWRKEFDANRVLLLEPSVFEKYPLAQHTIDFVLKLSENIPGIQVCTGEFSELSNGFYYDKIYFKEHPLNSHYHGNCDERDWLTPVKGNFPSFFSYWRKAKPYLQK
jgi:deoxyribodipyrimidine photo-lyase